MNDLLFLPKMNGLEVCSTTE